MLSFHNDDYWTFTVEFDFPDEREDYIKMLFEADSQVEQIFVGTGEKNDVFVVQGVISFYEKVNRKYAEKHVRSKNVYPISEGSVKNQENAITKEFKNIRQIRTYRMPEIIKFKPKIN